MFERRSQWIHAVNLEHQLLALVEHMLSPFVATENRTPSQEDLAVLLRAAQQVP